MSLDDLSETSTILNTVGGEGESEKESFGEFLTCEYFNDLFI